MTDAAVWVAEKPTGQLRFVLTKDGVRLLQQQWEKSHYRGPEKVDTHFDWRDVPTVFEGVNDK